MSERARWWKDTISEVTIDVGRKDGRGSCLMMVSLVGGNKISSPPRNHSKKTPPPFNRPTKDQIARNAITKTSVSKREHPFFRQPIVELQRHRVDVPS